MRQHTDKGRSIVKVTAIVLFILYLSVLLYLTFLSQLYGRGYFHRSMNLVPLRTVLLFLNSGREGAALVNIFGNIAAFVPMGLILPLISDKLTRLFRVMLFTCGVSLLIEIMQYSLAVGAADIDDLILNTAGGLAGYGLYAFGSMLIRRIVRMRL